MLYYILVPLAWVVWHIGFRIQVIGRENLRLEKGRGFILAPNHISAIDPVFVIIARFWGKRMCVFAKKELFEKNFLLSWFLTQAGCVAVRGKRDEAETLDKTVELCRAGGGLLLFPEGTRSKDGTLGKPKSGLFVVADRAAVDVIPCRILYDTPDGRMKLFCRVRVIFGRPMPAEQFAMNGRRDMQKLRENKQALVDCWKRLCEQNKF